MQKHVHHAKGLKKTTQVLIKLSSKELTYSCMYVDKWIYIHSYICMHIDTALGFEFAKLCIYLGMKRLLKYEQLKHSTWPNCTGELYYVVHLFKGDLSPWSCKFLYCPWQRECCHVICTCSDRNVQMKLSWNTVSGSLVVFEHRQASQYRFWSIRLSWVDEYYH